MERLLYINNYNCTCEHRPETPDNHLWGADALSKHYDVTCASVPSNIFKPTTRWKVIANDIYKNGVLFLRYWHFPIVYSACSEFTLFFALANLLHIGKRKLFKIHHHGKLNGKITFCKGYSKILFLSNVIMKQYGQVENKVSVLWGGDGQFAKKAIENTNKEKPRFDFVSAGKSGRDHATMIKAAEKAAAKAMIISAVNGETYDAKYITILAGKDPYKNVMGAQATYAHYLESRYIVIPIIPRSASSKYTLAGLTTFVDAVVLGKPVLISDNTNIDIDIEGLNIGRVYKAGDTDDMRRVMQELMELSNNEYNKMCDNMKKLAETLNYKFFCEKLLSIISE